ncbi:fatty acid synthase [Polychytrium aggregatum]|uniref:fatty acid synthase n=1 Tax=Polychytrium aggregatum TaxID=110093 RepID=UPI0022FF1967|nr:fatty acid synthase [Polychytrium aggregatum]KAI9205069.1 fatty acid synthase [Polychytrium aggregatum]
MASTAQATTRPLNLKQNGLELSIPVPFSLWPVAEHIKDALPVSDEETTAIELTANLLKISLDHAATDAAALPFVALVLSYFHRSVLKNQNIHAVTRSLAAAARASVIKNYYQALVAVRKQSLVTRDEFLPHESALFAQVASEQASIFAVFGGQGNVEEYFDELVFAYETYSAFSIAFVRQAALTLAQHSESERAQNAQASKIDVISWLERPETRPSTNTLLDTHLSLPLIGLTQLLNYWIMLKIVDKTPAEVRTLFTGTTGHSQGIISSVVIASSETDKEFLENTQKALGLLFWLGLRSQNAVPRTTINPNILQDSLSNNEGIPTPMLAVTGLRSAEVVKHVEATNKHLPADRRVHLSLINGPRSTICTGPPQSLYGLNVALRKIKAPTGLDQSRVPHSERKIRFSSRFLPVAVPFHSEYLVNVPAQLEQDISELNLDFDAAKIAIPVYHTNTGEDLRNSSRLTISLVEQICTQAVHWEIATKVDNVTHILDFGPGGSSGIGGLTQRNKEGTGVQVVLASTLDAQSSLPDQSAVFDYDVKSVKRAINWADKYKPRLIQVAGSGKIHLDTPFSRLLGKPPLMVAGMTPCTVEEPFVAAVINAGFHVELAGGGQHTEQYLRRRVNNILQMVPAGEAITLNCLFLNPRLWGFQYPLVRAMRKEGVPMEGITVAAGVPSIDVADDIVINLKASGLKHVAFKPGSVDTILRVVNIARKHPDFPIILQWTGGRGGGHHSFEDFHAPMLETYGQIRRCENIILVVGSGFGGHEDTLPYLSGEWSTKFDYAPMPFDGILLGSRVMVAEENKASISVKQLIVDAPGITDESQWEKTYKGPIGNIVTVKSELGEPIHKIANRGILFWKEMDDTIFSLPKEKRVAALLQRKDYIIDRLNKDFQKPWFGRKADGRSCELHEMTYKEVADRLLDTTYIKHQTRWIDFTLKETFGDFLRRVEERFSKKPSPSLIQSYSVLDSEPIVFSEGFFDAFPEARVQTLTQEDVFHFLAITTIPWRKPGPFIPVLDDKFEFWFKKDSLWQSEDVDAVPDQDVGRVAILQGPVAVAHSKVVNEPVKDILGNIYNAQIEFIKEKYYNGDEASIPVAEYLGASPARIAAANLPGVKVTHLDDGEIMYELSGKESELPSGPEFFEILAGPKLHWLRALLTESSIFQGKQISSNPVHAILRPRPNQTLFAKFDAEGNPVVLTVYSQRSPASSKLPDRHPAVVITREGEAIAVTVYEKRDADHVPLQFFFKYVPSMGYALIHEVMEGRNQRIKDFYAALWYISPSESALTPTDVFRSTFVVDKKRLQDFTQIIGNHAELYSTNTDNVPAPMDFAIVAGWKSLVGAILPKEIDGDLLRLVHLSNEFRQIDSKEIIRAGDEISTEAIINSVIISEAGKTVEVKAVLSKNGSAVIEIISRFLYRGKFSDYENTFRRTAEKPMQVELKTKKDVAVLKSKKWIQWNETAPEITPSSVLIFRLESFAKFKNATVFSHIATNGSVFLKTTRETVEIGKVVYEADVAHGNVVMEYLNRHGKPIEQAIHFKNGGYSILPGSKVFPAVASVPGNNETYAKSSGDLNPIHVNPYIADLAGLPGTITHGMWTSASTRKFVEIFAANNQPQRVKAYQVTFMDMVLPGDQLETKLSHVGMLNGKKLIQIETFNQRGAKVLVGSAEVEQPTTSYVFTGQGSQEVGMGMDLYASSPVAKEIWDRADQHMLNTYGVSILEIVRSNPKSKTVHFGGIKGAAVRRHYQGMTYDVLEDGQLKSLPLFPGINDNTLSFTFTHPTGLLSATQFTQPALTLMEIASFQDMKANGFVQSDCAFAGHSLGEYAGLSAVGGVLSIESLVDVVFYRGMTMQTAVPRDSEGRSDYGMCAINPIRVGPTLGEQALRFIIDGIARRSNNLLEIVNFNVENFQYVAAGELTNLETLRLVLDKIKALKVNFIELTKTKTLEEIEELLNGICDESLEVARKKKAANKGLVIPERGVATIPLPGIDVPFHSSFLLNGVVPFREVLRRKLEARFVNVSLLVGKYIPNLTAEPFSISKDYFERVHKQTGSAWLTEILANWDEETNATSAGQQHLAYVLLIELLAHQFASPVRWIETQDRFFREYDVERFIEVGPSPVLCGMAGRTLKIKYEAYDDAVTARRVTLCTTKDRKDIYYQYEDAAPAEPEAAPAAPAAAAAAAPAPAPVAVAAPAPVAVAAGSVSDEPVSAKEILLVLVAHKLKKPLAEIPLNKSIKDLVGGKSTLQNEILGDLGAEFGNVLADKAEENALGEIANALQNGHSGALGKTSSGLINKLVSGKMPAGFGMGQVKAHLKAAHGLGPKRTEGALLHGLLSEPASRLSSEADAKAWLDATASSYAAKVGISLGGGAPAAAAGPIFAAAAPAAAAAGPIPDEPLTAKEVLVVLVAQKLKKPIAEIPLNKSIKDLVGGKSTLQNEILGDLGAEFGNVLADKAEENALGEIANALQNGHSGALGKTSSGLINKLVSGKMPAGFGMGQVKAHLSSKGLGPKRTDGVLLHGLVSEPASRLGSEAEAKAWLDATASSYAAKVGVSLGGGAAGGVAVGGAVVAMNSEEFNLHKMKTDLMIREQLELFAKYLDVDLLEGAHAAEAERGSSKTLQKEIDLWNTEHGEFYADGIKPLFTILKARKFDSHWNWARQDAIQLYYDFIFGRLTSVDRELMDRCLHIMNRADDFEGLVQMIEYYISTCPEENGENYSRAKTLGKVLLDNVKESLKADPVYKSIAYRPTQPKTTISADGKLVYKEERRAASNMKDYVKEMRAGSQLTKLPNTDSVKRKFEELQALVRGATELDASVKTSIDSIFAELKDSLPDSFGAENLPFIFLKKRDAADPSHWNPDCSYTEKYLDILSQIAAEGLSFKGRHALLTGCGRDSIGVEILKALLQGGASVIVTTSRFSKSVTEYYRSIYEQYGSKGSRLVVVPFNGGSLQDTKALVDYIYDKDLKNGLGWDLDFVVPFAAIPEQGRELDGIDSRSELAHRIMLTNLLRLLGEIKIKKQQNGYDTRPAAVMLPLSPNHGTFGGDGLYGESKIALETLMNRFHAEKWSSYLTIIGAVIGWTRGTGLMSGNNMVAEGIESLGARTFSTHEMAFNLVGLLHPDIVKLSGIEPIWADLNGGLHFVADLNTVSSNLRRELMETSEIRRAIAQEEILDNKTLKGPAKQDTVVVTPRANMKFQFPELRAQKLKHLEGVLDLEKVIVVTGFGEVGPFGGSRTRWEMEAFGELSLEGCIEMAWIMGFIKFHNGPLGKIPNYSGWIDVATKEPVQDFNVKSKYEEKILEHTGIRLIESELFQGYNPNKKLFLQEVAITTDMAPIEVSKEEADAFKLQHGDAAVIENRGDQLFLRMKKGSTLYVPKALKFSRLVAGQIPTGWDAARYGVPADIVSQVDPITLYALVATVEALVTSGVTDPYEFYQYIHVSELGNTSGGGMGGMRALQKLFKERLLEKPVQNDILQESFINTMPAWVNMLLLSSSGPIKTPVGACATAAESVDIAVDTLLSGRAKVVICGGYDDFQEEGSYEFANMKATSDSLDEFARGREPRDMCRPASDTRGGFMESQGAGIHVLMTADLAVKMGVPIRAIVACTNTATDKNSRSVPAPGQGILTTARETQQKHKSPLLNFEYRAKQLKREREYIKTWVANEYEALADEVSALKAAGEEADETFIKERTAFIEKEGKRREKAALATWSHEFAKQDPTISPIRAALATYGLSIDDIGVASFHGTGTKANDYNESSAVNQQLAHLGRTKGNVLPSIFQKYLTGHPKGAAAAWMLNGVIQVLETGIIPGNRNLDNAEDRLSKFKYILYPSRSIQTDGIKAGLLKSFGFGQAGGEILVIHPDYALAALETKAYNEYLLKREKRQAASYRYFHETLTGVGAFVRVKSAAPYTDAQQSSVYLNPLARATFDKKAGSWNFNSNTSDVPKPDVDVTKALLSASAEIDQTSGRGVGLDVQLISEINAENPVFVERNFTEQEQAYCTSSSCPVSSYAGRWAAKEAVVKAVSSAAGTVVWDQGSAAPLKDIEITREEGKAPVVTFHGDAKAAVEKAGITEVKITISHSGSYAVAMAVAK